MLAGDEHRQFLFRSIVRSPIMRGWCGEPRPLRAGEGEKVYDRRVIEERGKSEGTGASRRGAWPVRKYALGHEPGDDLSASTTPEERLAIMWRLTLEAWALSGAALPDYARRDAPVRRLPGHAA